MLSYFCEFYIQIMSFYIYYIQQVLSQQLMQPYQLSDSRKSGSNINNEGDNQQINFTFQWATIIPFKPHDSVKSFTVNSILRNNSRYFTNCLIYVKDKTQQEQLKLSIQKDTKLITKCCSSNDLLNISDQFSKTKIFVVRLDENLIDNYHIPRCFDLVFFMSIPKLEDYQNLVRKQIKRQTKSKCGLVINCCSSPADEKIVAQFVEKAKVKTNTYQQLSRQQINLSRYFKLEDISFENKNSLKSKQDNLKSPEVQSKIQTEDIQSTKSKRNLNWATYLIVSTQQQYKAGRAHNYIKLSPNFINCCIVYTKAESRAKFILQRLPQQIKNRTSVILNYPKNYLEYLQKLQQKQLKVLIIVNNNQDFYSHSSQFYVPSTVNLIISDNMPTRQTFNQRFGKIKQTNQGGVIISMVSSYNESEEFKSYCKQQGVKINDQHRKDDYDLDKYIKPSSDNIQKKLKESKSPGKTENLLNKNNQNIAKKQTVNQTNQQLPKKQQTLQLANKIDVKSSIGEVVGVKSHHSSEQDPLQIKEAEKKQQKDENASSSPSEIKIEISEKVGKENVEQKQLDVQGQQKALMTEQNNQVDKVEQNIADNTEDHQADNITTNQIQQNNLPKDIAANQEKRQELKVIEDKKAEQGSETEEKNINQKSEYVETEKIVQTEKTEQTEQTSQTEPKEKIGQAENPDKKSSIDPIQSQKKQNPSDPLVQPKIEQASQNPIPVEPTNNNKSPTIVIGPQMFTFQQKQKQDINSSSDPAQKQQMQLSNTLYTKQLQLSYKLEQLPKKIQQLETRIDSHACSSIKENNQKINQTVTNSSQQVTESVSNGVENLESILTTSLSNQKTLLQNSLTSITNCIQTENQKNYAKINQIRQETAQIKIIADDTKQICEKLPSITGSIQSIKQDLGKDMKLLQRITFQVEQTQTSNSQTILSKIGEENNSTNNLIKQTAAQHKNMIDTEFRNINQKQVQIYNQLKQVPGKLQSIENDVKRNLSNQKIQLQESVKIIKTCVEAQNQKNLAKISQVRQETSQIKIIADDTKQICEKLPSITGSIQSMKQDFRRDINNLSKINLQIEETQKSNSQTIISKIEEANNSTSKYIKETVGQQKIIISSEFQNINRKQSEIQNKLEQVPGKLQNIYNETSVKLNDLNSKLEKQSKSLEQNLKLQAQTNTNSIIQTITLDSKKHNQLIKVQNENILKYINVEKKKILEKNLAMIDELNIKKQAMESYQKNRIAQFERNLNVKEKTSSDAELKQKIKQLEKKYEQSKIEVESLRTYKVNFVKTSEELARVNLELSQARKIENKFNVYKKRFGVQTATYDLLAKSYTDIQKECGQLKNQISAYKLQLKDFLSIRDELNAAKESIYSIIPAKTQKKEPEVKVINKMIRQGAANTVVNPMLMKSMAQIEKIPKQALTMNLPTLIKTYFLAQAQTLNDLKPYLSNLVKSFPSKQSESLLTEINQVSACKIISENALKSLDQQSGSYQLILTILKLIGQHETLKRHQINISKYSRELEITLRTLNVKTDQVVKQGTQLSVVKILDYNNKQSVINVDLEEICKNVNILLSNLNCRTSQLTKANLSIEELKKQINTQRNIINTLNGKNTTLTADLKQAKETITKLQNQLTQTQNDLSTMTANLKKTATELAQTKTKLSQTFKTLDSVTKTLQQATRKYNNAENTLKQTAAELSTTKVALQEKQKLASTQKQQLATNDIEINKLKRALQDEKIRASDAADEADKKILELKKKITEAATNYKDLQQKSERQIKGEKQKNQQQIKKKQDDIREIMLENENQRAKLLGQMKQFEDSLNKSIKVTLEYEPKLTINNYKDKFPQFSKAILQRQSKSKFLAESSTYRHMNEEDRLFVFESIKRVVNRKIDYTKTLFQGYSGVNFDEWLFKIYNKTNLLVLITLTNGHIIGGFSENAFSKEKVTKGKGYMMSVTNKRIYDIKTRHEGKVAKYDDFMFIFGNNELLIKNNLTFTAIFARQFCYFETGDDKIQDFLGQEQEEGTFKSVEFHQVIFS